MAHPFAASLVKLERARGFITELQHAFEAYIASDPIEQTNRLGPLGIWSLWQKAKPLGLLHGAILGDAVHNMRTALDLMASDLAVINHENTKGVYFPFGKSQEDLEKQIKDKFLKTGPDAVALLRTFTPYTGGNEMLRGLHDLDIQDKHTGIILAVEYHGLSVDVVKLMSGHPKPADLTHMIFTFPPESPFHGEEVIPRLEQIMQTVEGVLEAFAALVASRTP